MLIESTALTSGNLLRVQGNNAGGGIGIALIEQLNASSGAPTLVLDQQGTGPNLDLNGNGWIRFPATPVASTDANTLDTYEEGSYDADCRPTVSGSFTIPASSNELTYIKIGRLVHVQGTISHSANNAAVGDILIDLPFPVGSFADSGESMRVGVYNLGFSGTNPVADGIGVRVQLFSGDTTAEIKRLGAAVGTVTIAPAWAAFGSLTFNFTYVVED
jgi:hypothetical protein